LLKKIKCFLFIIIFIYPSSTRLKSFYLSHHKMYLFHPIYRLTNIPHIKFRQKITFYQIHLACHLSILHHKHVRPTIQIFPFHSSYHFTTIPHIFLNHTKYKYPYQKIHLFKIIQYILIHLPIQIHQFHL